MPDNPADEWSDSVAEPIASYRGTIIAVVAGFVLLVTACAIYVCALPQRAQRQYLEQQQQLAQPVLTPDLVIYTDATAQFERLIANRDYMILTYAEIADGEMKPIPREGWPMALRYRTGEPFQTADGVANVGEAFRGKLIAGDGTTRIVGGLVGQRMICSVHSRLITLQADVITPASDARGARANAITVDLGAIRIPRYSQFTLHAGVPDTADHAVLRFNYDLDDYLHRSQHGQIEARMNPGGVFTLRSLAGIAECLSPEQVLAAQP